MVRDPPARHASRMTSAPLPNTPPLSAPARPALRRSGTDRMAGGVCGGLADYSGIDSLLWRVGFVALTLAGGAGVLVYLLLWIFMPSAPLPPPGPSGPGTSSLRAPRAGRCVKAKS